MTTGFGEFDASCPGHRGAVGVLRHVAGAGLLPRLGEEEARVRLAGYIARQRMAA